MGIYNFVVLMNEEDIYYHVLKIFNGYFYYFNGNGIWIRSRLKNHNDFYALKSTITQKYELENNDVVKYIYGNSTHPKFPSYIIDKILIDEIFVECLNSLNISNEFNEGDTFQTLMTLYNFKIDGNNFELSNNNSNMSSIKNCINGVSMPFILNNKDIDEKDMESMSNYLENHGYIVMHNSVVSSNISKINKNAENISRKKRIAEVSKLKIECLNLPKRVYSALKRAGVNSIKQVLALYNSSNLYEIRDIGFTSVELIEKSLFDMDLIANHVDMIK